MFRVSRRRLHLFRQFRLLLCFLLLLPLLLSCGALNRVDTPTTTQTATASFTPNATATQTPTPTTIPTPTEIPALCGGPRVMFILLVGSDARQDSYAIGLADWHSHETCMWRSPRLKIIMESHTESSTRRSYTATRATTTTMERGRDLVCWH